MRKIPTLFLRDPENRSRVTREINPDCQWVIDGEGVATRKYDGTCVMLADFDERWYARREVKAGKAFPPNYTAVHYDPVTGKTMGWEPIEQSAFAKFHAEAVQHERAHGVVHEPGTYELIGPKINGNPEGYPLHFLQRHAEADTFSDAPRDYDGLREWLFVHPQYEGIVWHHLDGRMAKLKRKDVV